MHFPPSAEDLNNVVPGGQNRTYTFIVPPDAEPGLFWYHDHVHGKNAHAYMSSLFGFIIVEGTDRDLMKAEGVEGAREILLMLSEGLVNPEDGTVPPFFPIAMQFDWAGVTNGNLGGETVFKVKQHEPIVFRAASATVEPTIRMALSGNQSMVVLANDGLPVPAPQRTDAVAVSGRGLPVPPQTNIVTVSGGGRVNFLARFDTPGTYILTRAAWNPFPPTAEWCMKELNIPEYPCISYDKEQIVATIEVEEDAGPGLLNTVQLPPYSEKLQAMARQESVDSKTITFQQQFGSPLFQVPAVPKLEGVGVPTGFGVNNR